MRRLAKIKCILAGAMLAGMTFAVYADDAPVYEVDNYPPPFDSQPTDAPSATVVDPSSGGLTAEVSGAPSNPVFHESPHEAEVESPPPPPPSRPLTPDQRLKRAEQQIKNLQQSSALAKADDLQKEVQSLRGQVEEMSHQLQQVQAQQKAMYADLDKRLAGVQVTKPTFMGSEANNASTVKSSSKLKMASTGIAPAKVVQQPNPAEEQQIYQTAYDLIKAKKYNDAVATLQKMLQKYPTGQTAANGHYWLGELYGLLNKSDQSAKEFSLVVKNYPSSAKASDAQLKLGLIYAGQFKWPEAKTAFKGVVGRYPGTASARLATEQLKQIKKAGH